MLLMRRPFLVEDDLFSVQLVDDWQTSFTSWSSLLALKKGAMVQRNFVIPGWPRSLWSLSMKYPAKTFRRMIRSSSPRSQVLSCWSVFLKYWCVWFSRARASNKRCSVEGPSLTEQARERKSAPALSLPDTRTILIVNSLSRLFHFCALEVAFCGSNVRFLLSVKIVIWLDPIKGL